MRHAIREVFQSIYSVQTPYTYQFLCVCGHTTGWSSFDDAHAQMDRHLEAYRDPEALVKLSVTQAQNLIMEELLRAMKKHPTPFHSAHDGWAKIHEEHDEMWDEVKKDDAIMTRKECIHLGAMALRYLIDITTK